MVVPVIYDAFVDVASCTDLAHTIHAILYMLQLEYMLLLVGKGGGGGGGGGSYNCKSATEVKQFMQKLISIKMHFSNILIFMSSITDCLQLPLLCI